MGKVAFVGLIAATVALLDDLGRLSAWHLDCAVFADLLLLSTLLFALDLKRFFQNPYPFRTKVIDVLLSTALGDYLEKHRCWFNWQLNLYGSQCFAKEVLFDKWDYRALCACKEDSSIPFGDDWNLDSIESEEIIAQAIGDYRNFEPTPRGRYEWHEESGQFIPRTYNWERQSGRYTSRTAGLEDEWPDSDVNLQQVTVQDKKKVCFMFYTIASCQIKLKVQIEDPDLFECMVEVYRAGAAKSCAEHVELFTERDKVGLLFAFFEEYELSPFSGVVDVRKGGVKNGAKLLHCFRIQDAMKFMNDSSRVILGNRQHVDHCFWIL